MKRIVLSAFLILGITVPLATPAQAIFGLSTCEKVKKKILAEEEIGKESWHQFDVVRDQYVRDKKILNWELMELFRLVNLVHKSDLIVNSIATKNSACFTPKINASIRKNGAELKRTYDVIEKGINNYKSIYANNINIDGYNFLKNYYDGYISIYDIK